MLCPLWRQSQQQKMLLLLLWTLLIVHFLMTCGRSVDEKRKKAELKKKREERPKKKTRPTRRKKPRRSTTTTSRTGTGGGSKPYAMSPMCLDKTQKTASSDHAKPRLSFNYLAPVQPQSIVEEDLCRCKDYIPEVLIELQYIFDLLSEH